MQWLRNAMDQKKALFEQGGRWERFHPVYELADTFLFSPGLVTRHPAFVRDAVDLKRIMVTVIAAVTPCALLGVYNTGFQALKALDVPGMALYGWQGSAATAMGLTDDAQALHCFLLGLMYFLPVFLTVNITGGLCELIFCVVRKEEVNEGLLVTGMLLPLILPPTIPLWQVAMGTAFGIVIGKEVFGGTGMNIVNPALAARAFLFFAYPAQMSGDKIWIAVAPTRPVDGFSGATALGWLDAPSAPHWIAQPAEYLVKGEAGLTWLQAFVGLRPGCMGETSTLLCLAGAAFLVFTGVASWRIIVGVVLGGWLTVTLLNAIGSQSNALMNLPFYWQAVLGGWAFGAVFMATDPVTSPYTNTGRFVYGILIGVLSMVVRIVNPAYPEGMMLAILFANICAPMIDQISIRANIRRRAKRCAV